MDKPVAPQSITGADTSQADAAQRADARGRCVFPRDDSGSKPNTIATRAFREVTIGLGS
jgi:hypothetical protein